MKILVLMSSYNGERYIEKQIESIFAQTIADCITLRIRDDGSTDNTVRIIRNLSRYFLIEYIAGENIGYNASFISLINDASGYDYYALSDQDDIWLRSKLEVAVNALENEDGASPLLYASTSYLVNDDLIPYGQTRRKRREFTIYNTAIQNICPGHTQVMNNALLEVLQGQHINSDNLYVYDSWITNMAVLYGKIIFNNSSFVLYRQHMGNQLGSGTGKMGQMITSIHRNVSGDGYKYRRQIEYLVKKNEEALKRRGYYDEVAGFISAKNIFQKMKYLSKCQLYRQSRFETMIFDIAVLSGKY